MRDNYSVTWTIGFDYVLSLSAFRLVDLIEAICVGVILLGGFFPKI